MKMFTFLVALLFAATNLSAQCTAYFQSTVSGNTASFFASNSGGGTINNNTYVWDFGDNTTGTGVNATHTYTNTTAATYTACVTMTEVTGCTATFCNTVVINGGTSCNVSTSFTYSTTPNGTTFTSSISGFAPNVTYSWSFAPGTVGSTLANPTAQLANGTYNICLTVSDGTCSDTYCAMVTVGNSNPCAGFAAYFQFYTTVAGATTFWGSGANGTIGGNGLIYNWSFGNGAAATGAVVTHFFSGTPVLVTPNGSFYQACLTITNPTNGCTATYCAYINITPIAVVLTNPGGPTTNNTGGVFGSGNTPNTPKEAGSGSTFTTTEETTLAVFPNPATDVLNVAINSESINGNLTIINASGQTVYQENVAFKGATQISLPVQDLPTGIYFVQLLSNDIQNVVKFVKQ